MKKILLACLFITSCSTSNIQETSVISDSARKDIEDGGIQEESFQEDNLLLQQAIDSSHRSQESKKRDQFRHPLETLRFFEVDPDMTVVELWPGGKGWYTEILAPYLKENGKLFVAHFSPDSEKAYFVKNLKKFKEKTSATPEIYEDIVLTILQPPQSVTIAPSQSVDRVLTFRNFHNWMKNDKIINVLSAAYSALKPGGILGIVEHRALSGEEQDPKALSGYVKESHVITLAEKVGFKFSGKSEVNANPKDTTQHPEGVWSLPPSLRLKNQDRDKYLSIGESDRMTLKFLKPNKEEIEK